MQDNEQTETISKGTAWLTFNQLVFMATSYITYMFLARTLGPASFGIYGIVIGLVTILTMVLITGTQQVVAKFISETPKEAEAIKKKAFQLQLIFAGSITIVYYFSSSVIAYLLHDQSITQYIQLSSLIILFHSLFSVFMGYFNGLKQFKQQALYTASYHFGRMILTILFVMLGLKIFGAISAFVISSFLFFTVCLILIGFKEKGKKIEEKIKKDNFITIKSFSTKRFISFTIPIMLSTIVIYLIMNIDLFLIKALSQTSIANQFTGYYTAVQTIAKIPYFLISALPVVLFPLVSNSSFAKNTEKTQDYIKKGLRYTFMLLLPLTVIIASSAEKLLTLLYSAEYIAGAGALFILTFGMLFLGIFTLFTIYISGSDNPKISFYFACITLIFTIILNYFLIPKYSMIGASIATTIGLFFGMIITAIYIYKKYKVLLELNSFLRICYAAIIVYITAWFIPFTGYMLLIEYFILTLIYLLILYLCKEINDEDILLIKRLLNR